MQKSASLGQRNNTCSWVVRDFEREAKTKIRIDVTQLPQCNIITQYVYDSTYSIHTPRGRQCKQPSCADGEAIIRFDTCLSHTF